MKDCLIVMYAGGHRYANTGNTETVKAFINQCAQFRVRKYQWKIVLNAHFLASKSQTHLFPTDLFLSTVIIYDFVFFDDPYRHDVLLMGHRQTEKPQM